VQYASPVGELYTATSYLLPAVCGGVGQLSVKRHGKGWRKCAQLPYGKVASLMVAVLLTQHADPSPYGQKLQPEQ